MLAAAYGYGLARNRAFVDGNKRIAFLAMVTFLGLNDIDFVVPEPDAVVMTLAVAAGRSARKVWRAGFATTGRLGAPLCSAHGRRSG